MVRLLDRGPRAGVPGKLRGDPAVETAAVAASLGLDPLRFLALGSDDAAIYAVALERATKIQADRDKWFVDAISTKTAGLTARFITRWLARALRS